MKTIAQRYQRAMNTVKRKIDEVLSVVLRYATNLIKPVEGEFTRVSPFLRDDTRYWPYFRDCIGALDGTHILVRIPNRNAEAYRGRKSEPIINVIAICNFEMKFIYAYVGVPGRAHDTRVLNHYAKKEASFPHPPDEKYYLVDSDIPQELGTLDHIVGLNIILISFRGRPPSNMQELFNRKHSGLRSVIERTFGIWKAKWRILDCKHPKYVLARWIKIVTTTMTLHKFVRDSHRENHDFLHWQTMEHYQTHGNEGSDDDAHDEHTTYEATSDRVMGELLDTLTYELGRRRRLPY